MVIVSWMPEGRPLSTITRCPSSTASSIEWVTKTMAVGRCSQMCDGWNWRLTLYIDRGERLIHQQYVGLNPKSAGKTAALLRSGHLIGKCLFKAREAHHFDEHRHLALDLRPSAVPAMRRP